MKPKHYPLLILVPALLLFCGWVTGIHWYNDEPATTTLANTDVFSLQKVGPNTYRYITVLNMKSIFNGAPGVPVPQIIAGDVYITSNYVTVQFVTNQTVNQQFVTTNYTTNAFITLLTVNSNAYFLTTNFINYNITTNLEVISNAYFFETNFNNYNFTTNLTVLSNAYFLSTNYFNYIITTNIEVISNAYFFATNFNTWNITTNIEVISNAYFYETNFVNWDITTNLTVISNATVRGNLTINNIRITNGFHRALTTWVGPTNSLDVGTNFWIYTAPSDCAITNFTGGIAGFASDTALVVTNAATSNITFRITAGGNFLDYVKSYTVTNGDVLHLAIERQGTAGADVVGRTGHPL